MRGVSSYQGFGSEPKPDWNHVQVNMSNPLLEVWLRKSGRRELMLVEKHESPCSGKSRVLSMAVWIPWTYQTKTMKRWGNQAEEYEHFSTEDARMLQAKNILAKKQRWCWFDWWLHGFLRPVACNRRANRACSVLRSILFTA